MKISFKPVYIRLLAIVLMTIVLMTIALMTTWLRPAPASTLLDSRVRQLEFQVRSLQTQLSSSPSTPRPNTPAPPIDIPTVSGDPTLAQQFDNLANLAIELKQRVSALEEQVAQLSQ